MELVLFVSEKLMLRNNYPYSMERSSWQRAFQNAKRKKNRFIMTHRIRTLTLFCAHKIDKQLGLLHRDGWLTCTCDGKSFIDNSFSK